MDEYSLRPSQGEKTLDERLEEVVYFFVHLGSPGFVPGFVAAIEDSGR